MPDYAQEFVQSCFECLDELHPGDEAAKAGLVRELAGIENADSNIAAICSALAIEVYGSRLPDIVKERLDAELGSIIENGFSFLYMIAYMSVEKSRAAGYPVCASGSVGASVVAYLLGISDFDPIAFSIPFETFGGLHGEKWPYFTLQFSDVYLDGNQSYLEEILEYHKPESMEASSIYLLRRDTLTTIHKLEELTGVDANSIPLDDEKTLHLLANADTVGIPLFEEEDAREMIRIAKPQSFDDFIRIAGLSFGTDTWFDNAENLIKSDSATIAEVISSRDELMLYLMEKGVCRERAFAIMENIRKGKGLAVEDRDRMKESGVPEWYVESCGKIQYLFPKAHAVAHTMLAFRLAWYKAHYPEAFDTTALPLPSKKRPVD